MIDDIGRCLCINCSFFDVKRGCIVNPGDDRYHNFFNSVSCLFVEGVEFSDKIQLYDAIKKDWQKCCEGEP